MGKSRYLALQRCILQIMKEARAPMQVHEIANCIDENFHTTLRHLRDLQEQKHITTWKENGVSFWDFHKPVRGNHAIEA